MFHKNDMFHTSIGFDMRVPDFAPLPPKAYYAEALDMIAYADKHGIDKVDFQEHHRSEDGYLPTPFLMGAAAASRTSNIAIVLGAVILPFHDPVKIAEQIAVADLISGGRFYTVLAAGYSPTEFAAFRVLLKDRGRLMDEGLQIILRALSGERFMDKDREVFVRPLPSRPPHEIVYAGGGSAASARRAARLGLSMWPMNDSIIPDYEDECRKLGREPGRFIRSSGGGNCYITEDPERGWAEIGKYVLHNMSMYAKWSVSAETSTSPLHGLDTLEKIRAANVIQVVTPEQAVEIGRVRAIGMQPMIGGLPPEFGWKSVELFVQKVIPRIKNARQEWLKSQGLTA